MLAKILLLLLLLLCSLLLWGCPADLAKAPTNKTRGSLPFPGDDAGYTGCCHHGDDDTPEKGVNDWLSYWSDCCSPRCRAEYSPPPAPTQAELEKYMQAMTYTYSHIPSRRADQAPRSPLTIPDGTSAWKRSKLICLRRMGPDDGEVTNPVGLL